MFLFFERETVLTVFAKLSCWIIVFGALGFSDTGSVMEEGAERYSLEL